ncbi:hypothetical protein BDV23DRAFT_180651 [Aspergillus alliaceus]|uniref:Uncharacterized protein n=1 Tax=Petromyces alliaceus TaxID=209559 RepID=A0A5N7CIL8_PETAA|nr:hypothetical protein BDV23DRAFT_180651 [Aspergillus alliaceus]
MWELETNAQNHWGWAHMHRQVSGFSYSARCINPSLTGICAKTLLIGRTSREESNKRNQHWLRCDDPKPPFFNDVFPILADAACQTALSQGLTSFRSPCPEASWDTEVFCDRIANIHTLNDLEMPYEAQPAMVQGTG